MTILRQMNQQISRRCAICITQILLIIMEMEDLKRLKERSGMNFSRADLIMTIIAGMMHGVMKAQIYGKTMIKGSQAIFYLLKIR